MKLRQSTKNERNYERPANPTKEWNIDDRAMFPPLKVQKSKPFSNWFTESNKTQNQTNTTQNLNETLLPPEILLQLTTELVINLQNCRTRLDQIQTITKVAIRYMNYDQYTKTQFENSLLEHSKFSTRIPRNCRLSCFKLLRRCLFQRNMVEK